MEDAGRPRTRVRGIASEACELLSRIAIDTNVLVELLRDGGSLRDGIATSLRAAADRGDSAHIPFICLGEFWRTMTETRGYGLSTDQVQLLVRRALRAMPALMPSQRFNEQWLNLAGRFPPVGAQIFDVQIAALCLHHDVSELWTFDARFPRVDGLRIVNPLEP